MTIDRSSERPIFTSWPRVAEGAGLVLVTLVFSWMYVVTDAPLYTQLGPLTPERNSSHNEGRGRRVKRVHIDTHSTENNCGCVRSSGGP
jgi:hypothetical protein